jgi:hypothetical protein
LLAHPAFQIRDQWRTELLPDSAVLLGTLVIDRAFDLEQGVDPADWGRPSPWRSHGTAPEPG